VAVAVAAGSRKKEVLRTEKRSAEQ